MNKRRALSFVPERVRERSNTEITAMKTIKRTLHIEDQQQIDFFQLMTKKQKEKLNVIEEKEREKRDDMNNSQKMRYHH